MSDFVNAQEYKRIDTLLSKASDTDQFSGSVLLAKNGEIIYSRTVGFADRERQMPLTARTTSSIASVGKMFTAVIISKLAETGKLNLKETISHYLPGTIIKNAGTITIEQLLNHTSGLGNYMNDSRFGEVLRSGSSPEVLLTLVEDQAATGNPPGSKYEYSNSGFIVLGKIIEKITGESYVDAVKHFVAGPSGMKSLEYSVKPGTSGKHAKGYVREKQGAEWSVAALQPLPAADGGVYTTAIDLFKFDKALYSNKLISSGSLKMMHDNSIDAILPGVGKMKYGFGAMRFDYKDGIYSWGHNGGFPGYACEYKHYFFPDGTEYTLIILANYDRVLRPILFEIQELLLDRAL